jgi:hypothetical protein
MKQRALNIVVRLPCCNGEAKVMLAFQILSMALRNQKDLDGIFCSEDQNTADIFLCLFVVVDCIFVSGCHYRLIFN